MMSLVTANCNVLFLKCHQNSTRQQEGKKLFKQILLLQSSSGGSKTSSIAAIMGGNCFGAPKLSLYCSVICQLNQILLWKSLWCCTIEFPLLWIFGAELPLAFPERPPPPSLPSQVGRRRSSPPACLSALTDYYYIAYIIPLSSQIFPYLIVV